MKTCCSGTKTGAAPKSKKAIQSDPLLALCGSGKELWADEHAGRVRGSFAGWLGMSSRLLGYQYFHLFFLNIVVLRAGVPAGLRGAHAGPRRPVDHLGHDRGAKYWSSLASVKISTAVKRTSARSPRRRSSSHST